jgi:hypothetical protein
MPLRRSSPGCWAWGESQQPLDLAADGQQLVHLLGRDCQADGVGAQLGVDRAAKADVDEDPAP